MANKNTNIIILEMLQDGVTQEVAELPSTTFPNNSGIKTLLELDEQSIISIEKPSINMTIKYYYKNK